MGQKILLADDSITIQKVIELTFSDEDFELHTVGNGQKAIDEIRQWPAYAPTPLHALTSLSDDVRLGGIYYKDEATRFGLGSFKALGGAYAVLQLLQRELTRRLAREVSADEIRDGSLRNGSPPPSTGWETTPVTPSSRG